VHQVVGLDANQPVLDRARAIHDGKGIQWVHGNVLDAELEPDSFDGVVCVAALHHMDATLGLTRFAQLVRPGGTVAVIGLAAHSWSDAPLVGVAEVSKFALALALGRRRSSAPKRWPPPLTYREMRALSARALPGVRYRRHLLGRYSLVWRKPSKDA
jgi:ubiquinone/menaquinone biosynthesis C-methylase UbiE